MKNDKQITYLNKINNSVYFDLENKKTYFEEWYYKNIFVDDNFAFSIIPGLYCDETTEYAFIQIRHNKLGTFCFKYQMREVEYTSEPYCLRIGDSFFYKDRIDIEIDEAELYIKGKIEFGKMKTIKESKLSPNIMGPLSYVSFLKYNQAVLSMHHKVNALITINDIEYDNIEGTGYIEKHWGQYFPDSYIKANCNTFEYNNASLFMEISKIPVGPVNVKNHTCILMIDNNEYRFDTYNFSKVNCKNMFGDKYLISFENKENKLIAEVYKGMENEITIDINKVIPRQINEKLDSGVKVKLYDNNGKLIFKDNSDFVGLEILKQ